MGRRRNINPVLREQIRKWVIYVLQTQFPREKGRRGGGARMARKMDLPANSITQVIRGKGSIGLDFFVALRKVSGQSADRLLSPDPPPNFELHREAFERDSRAGRAVRKKAFG